MAEQARISGFREESRGARMRIAEEAQPAFRRAVSWGAVCGGSTVLFTTAGVPVMTRLRMGDRRVLDTLIDAGVARSRSEALAWCVRLVAQHEADWIEELRTAMSAVEEVRKARTEAHRHQRLSGALAGGAGRYWPAWDGPLRSTAAPWWPPASSWPTSRDFPP